MGFRFNWEIKGHDKVIDALESDIESGNVAHAYLFAGPAGIGKHTLAVKTALILQCPQGYCGDCAVCGEIKKGLHADTLELADNGESLKIDPVLMMMEKLNLTRVAKYRILIIENIERITEEAANALLKMLEEPPPGVLFLLTSSNIKEVLPTVISRVRLFKMDKLADAEVSNAVRERYPLEEEDDIATAVLCAQGRPGEAFRLMEDVAAMAETVKYLDDVGALIESGDRSKRLFFAEAVAAEAKEEDDKSVVYKFLSALEFAARKRMLGAAGVQELNLPNADKYVKLLQKTLETRRLLKNNVNTRLLLENLLMSL